MYFLWQNKPAAVLGKSGDWIPKVKIPSMLEEIHIFQNPGEARYIQRTKYSKKGVSVLGEKAFKEKTHIKKLPVFREVPTALQESDSSERMYTDVEYLESLCEADVGCKNRIIFPAANQEQTTGTPFMREVLNLLNALGDYLAALDSKETRLREEIRQLDLLNSDRLHQVELYELTEEECTGFVWTLHEAQIERRRRKNELLSLLFSKEALKQVDLDAVKQAVGQIEALENQVYRCRVLTENDPFVQSHAYVSRKED